MPESLAILLLILIALPFVVFFSVKMATWAYLMARKRFDDECKRELRHNGD